MAKLHVLISSFCILAALSSARADNSGQMLTQLPQAAPFDGSELFYVVQDGISKKTILSNISLNPAGNYVWTGSWTFNGPMVFGSPSAVRGALGAAASGANGDITSLGTLNALLQAPYFSTPGNTVTLSGSTVPPALALFTQNIAGASTIANNTTLASVKISKSSDNATMAASGVWDELLISSNYGGPSFTGGRIGAQIQMNLNTATTYAVPTDGMAGIATEVNSTVNAGGSANNYFGSLFGSSPRCHLKSGATFFTICEGEEVNTTAEAGSSVASLVTFKTTLSHAHAVHGAYEDVGIEYSASTEASVGTRNGIDIGSNLYQWPIDPNGYVFQTQFGVSHGSVPSLAAGGIDLQQTTFSGVGNVGGGFAFRSPGMSIDGSGRGLFGFGLIDGTSGGLTIGVTEQVLSGTPTVSAGGSGYVSGNLASDAFGDIVSVVASGGVVTSVSVLARGYAASPPSNPVAFTALSVNSGTGFGAGLTLTEAWVGATALTLKANGSGTVNLGAGTDVVSLPVVTTGTPVASLCLDASNNIVKKTTTGPCI